MCAYNVFALETVFRPRPRYAWHFSNRIYLFICAVCVPSCFIYTATRHELTESAKTTVQFAFKQMPQKFVCSGISNRARRYVGDAFNKSV